MNTSVQVSVPIKHDLVSEAPEALRVVLSNATGSLAIMVGSDTIDILDNNPPPPGPTNPPAPTVWFTSSATVIIREGESWQLNLSRDMPAGNPGAALTVSYVIAQDSVATSADASLAPAGSVTFAAGQTSATLTVTAIDDSLIEVRERLKLALVPYPAPNQGPGAYIIGSPSEALLDIHDNNEVIFSDLTVDWLAPDDTWVNSPNTEVLWREDVHRWTVTLPPEEIPFAGELTNLKLLRRPHNSSGSWEEVPSQSVDPFDPNNPDEFYIYANPQVGDWDLTVRGVFYSAITAWLAAPQNHPTTAIHSTKWVVPTYDPGLRLVWDPDDAIWMDPLYYGPRIYPEYTLPPDHVAGQCDHTWVDVEVTLAMAPPQGFNAKVYMRSFDPDHEYNPPTDFEDFKLDPDDYHSTTLTPPEFWRRPDDNRFGSVVTGGGGYLLYDQISFAAGQLAKRNPFKILAIQPGNNFNVGATIHQEWADTPYMHLNSVNEVAIEGVRMTPNHSTDVLTVWRTLHIERDSMGPPPANEVFDPAEPFNDLPPNPLDVRDADISMLAEWFRPANIDVVADLQTYDVKDGADMNINFFMHNRAAGDMGAGPPPGAVFSKVEARRDVDNSVSFWSVQVIGAYEGLITRDHDDPSTELAVPGETTGGTEMPYSMIYLETVRDWTADVVPPVTFGGPDPAVRAAIYERRLVVHEVAHTFLGAHGTSAADFGIMGDPMTFGTDAENRFNAEQIGLLQSKMRPEG